MHHLLKNIFESYHLERFTDLHFEPYQQEYWIRIRTQGQLHLHKVITADEAKSCLISLKHRANLKEDHNSLAQDGRFHYRTEQGVLLYFRLNSLETILGTKYHLRLIENPNQFQSLYQQTFWPHLQQQLCHKGQMIIIYGAAGASKTTQLYNIIRSLIKNHYSIIMLEDPVEYLLNGVHQVYFQSNSAQQSRELIASVLRQDCDAVAIGEIRHPHTLALAYQSAVASKLTLTTLHAHCIADVFKRFQTLCFSPKNIDSHFRIFLGVHLIHILCPNCKQPHANGGYQANCCSECETGYCATQTLFEYTALPPDYWQTTQSQRSYQLNNLSRNLQTPSIFEQCTTLYQQGDICRQQWLNAHVSSL